jgi:hypothetical protein
VILQSIAIRSLWAICIAKDLFEKVYTWTALPFHCGARNLTSHKQGSILAGTGMGTLFPSEDSERRRKRYSLDRKDSIVSRTPQCRTKPEYCSRTTASVRRGLLTIVERAFESNIVVKIDVRCCFDECKQLELLVMLMLLSKSKRANWYGRFRAAVWTVWSAGFCLLIAAVPEVVVRVTGHGVTEVPLTMAGADLMSNLRNCNPPR